MKRATFSETPTFIDFGCFKHCAVLSEREINSDAMLLANFGLALKVAIDFLKSESVNSCTFT